MKYLSAFLTFCFPVLIFGQAQEATLISTWNDTTITPTSWLDSRYNDVWGEAINGHEFAIIGSTAGVHFIQKIPENL